MRIALGFDVHKLVKGRDLYLCGIKIPYDKGLLGHSDADVALHAIIDAILSAAGLPDIGSLFPDSDPKYKDIRSTELLKEVLKKTSDLNLIIDQVDVTIVCDKPKLSPFYSKMKQSLCELTNLSMNKISIKARSTEGLMNQEAIMCFCVVVLKEKNK
ncbi:MAG: 2-C-methyl-D-erythritol 2,4-cyclodiphosphate synthase [Thermodesulfobacteria bacterium]|nr:2-C-methyl-D-erythritol 2,4-cyclodiphosphate synthase [Thermodesulfobacteriota bacterium]